MHDASWIIMILCLHQNVAPNSSGHLDLQAGFDGRNRVRNDVLGHYQSNRQRSVPQASVSVWVQYIGVVQQKQSAGRNWCSKSARKHTHREKKTKEEEEEVLVAWTILGKHWVASVSVRVCSLQFEGKCELMRSRFCKNASNTASNDLICQDLGTLAVLHLLGLLCNSANVCKYLSSNPPIHPLTHQISWYMNTGHAYIHTDPWSIIHTWYTYTVDMHINIDCKCA